MAAGSTVADVHTASREPGTREPGTEKLTVHQLLRRGAAAYVKENRGDAATMTVQSVLAKISMCRTSALGGRWYECDDCGETTKLYNSCGDRHCPGCSGAKRVDFNDRASKLITPGVDHYQVIFTVPEIVSTLALANRSEIADLLFKSAWRAIKKTVTAEQGYDPAALMVLHTWNQKLEPHWHVHALVPGAGPATDGDGVKESVSPRGDGKAYLVDAINLRRTYRAVFLRGLKSLYRRGKLSFGGSVEHLRSQDEWGMLMDELSQQEWVSHIEPPPSELSEADHVVSYMTRYLTGGPISDHRILSADDREVTLLARAGRRTGGSREQVPMKLSTSKFVRRWCLHIQPHQLTKTRCFGGWSNSARGLPREDAIGVRYDRRVASGGTVCRSDRLCRVIFLRALRGRIANPDRARAQAELVSVVETRFGV